MSRKSGNAYADSPDGTHAVLTITAPRRGSFDVLVSHESVELLQQFTWHVVCGTNPFDLQMRVRKLDGYELCDDGDRRARFTYMARMLMHAPDGKVVRHVNGDPLDNRLGNLELLDREGRTSLRRRRTKSGSGYRDVKWNRTLRKWTAALRFRGENHLVGHFDDVHEAGAAVVAFRRQFGA